MLRKPPQVIYANRWQTLQMKYLPNDKFIIETKKVESELTTLLSQQIEPKKYFRADSVIFKIKI